MTAIIIVPLSVVIFGYVLICYFLSRTVIYLDRQPVPKTPKDYGMDFQNIEFTSADGVNLKGWLIPAKSNKLIVITHVGGLTKYGSTRQKVPTLYVQTRNDPWTELTDIQGFYENTPTEKEFFWIEGMTHRFQGYPYFGEHPEKMLKWLKRWM